VSETAQARAVPLAFQIGARTLLRISRALVRIPLDLDAARAATLPALPPLPPHAHGYSITSLPEPLVAPVARASGAMPFVRQRYTRYWTDLTIGFDAWFAGLSGNSRQSLKRKAKKLAQASGGTLDIRRFRTPEEVEAFHGTARAISARTYQERLLDAGLPDDPDFFRTMLALAAADRVRAWLLYVGEAPVAYLYCPLQGEVAIYAHVGHDPAHNELSPGQVLQLEAMRDLFADAAVRRFDFTEGEGQHKRQFATAGVPCVDLLLLRPTLANRATIAALGGFNAGVALAKRATLKLGLGALAKRLRRGG
jgi:CelD/BcsL family acetyltransferase involved in cellulose biosynthesis